MRKLHLYRELFLDLSKLKNISDDFVGVKSAPVAAKTNIHLD
jgi:hypothetical protein